MHKLLHSIVGENSFLFALSILPLEVYFLMFVSYRINEEKATPVSLNLTFKNGKINFYSCSIKILEGEVNSNYDFSSDVINIGWDPKKAKANLKLAPNELLCDALLEQDLF